MSRKSDSIFISLLHRTIAGIVLQEIGKRLTDQLAIGDQSFLRELLPPNKFHSFDMGVK